MNKHKPMTQAERKSYLQDTWLEAVELTVGSKAIAVGLSKVNPDLYVQMSKAVDDGVDAEGLAGMFAGKGAKGFDDVKGVESQTGVTKANAYKDEPVQFDTHQSEPLPISKVGNQSPQDMILDFDNFFKGSKVINEDGTPKTVYHGTNSDFDTFDISKSNVGNFGKGFYFAEKVEKVNSHFAKGKNANIMPVVLNIEKPFDMREIDKIFAEDYLK